MRLNMKYEHIAVMKETFDKFKSLKKYLLTPERYKITDAQMLEELVNFYIHTKQISIIQC